MLPRSDGNSSKLWGDLAAHNCEKLVDEGTDGRQSTCTEVERQSFDARGCGCDDERIYDIIDVDPIAACATAGEARALTSEQRQGNRGDEFVESLGGTIRQVWSQIDDRRAVKGMEHATICRPYPLCRRVWRARYRRLEARYWLVE